MGKSPKAGRTTVSLRMTSSALFREWYGSILTTSNEKSLRWKLMSTQDELEICLQNPPDLPLIIGAARSRHSEISSTYQIAIAGVAKCQAQQSEMAQTNTNFMLKSFLKTITRQQLLVYSIPWLAQFWSESDENREERLLAAEYPKLITEARSLLKNF